MLLRSAMRSGVHSLVKRWPWALASVALASAYGDDASSASQAIPGAGSVQKTRTVTGVGPQTSTPVNCGWVNVSV